MGRSIIKVTMLSPNIKSMSSTEGFPICPSISFSQINAKTNVPNPMMHLFLSICCLSFSGFFSLIFCSPFFLPLCIYNDKVGIKIYGQISNNIFLNAIDFDMSSFYPSSIRAMNIDPSTLIFKMQLDLMQYDIYDGPIPLNGVTWKKFVEEGEKDGSKEFIDNFQTGNYTTFGSKWMNMPSVEEVYARMKKELGD